MLLPQPFPNELLFSRIIRFCRLQGISSPQILNQIYGNNRACINPIVTAGISKIAISFKESGHALLTHQTLAPLFMYFYPRYAVGIRDAVLSADNFKSLRLTQLSCVKGQTKLTIKYCPLCIQENLYNFGASYWHRTHQIPGIASCYKHQQNLIHKVLPPRFRISVDLPYIEEMQTLINSSEESYLLACYANKLLEEVSKATSTFNIVTFKDSLREAGYVTNGGRIRRIELLSDFFIFTSNLQYPYPDLLPSSENDYKYFTNLMYGCHSQHIFKYILVGYWLSTKRANSGKPRKKLANNKSKNTQKDKEKAYWMLRKGVSLSKTQKKTGQSKAVLIALAKSYNIPEIKSPKKLTVNTQRYIIHLAWKGFHRFTIAKRLSVSIEAIERLISKVPGLVNWRKKCKRESTCRRYKCQIMRFMKTNPCCMRKTIKKECNAAFFWLYHNERGWLESVLPIPISVHCRP